MPPLHPNINHQHLPHSLETVDLWQPTTENLTGVHFYHYREVANTSLIINWYLYLTWSLLVFCYLCNSKEFVLYQAYSKFHPQVNGKDFWYGNTIKQLYLQSSTQENTYQHVPTRNVQINVLVHVSSWEHKTLSVKLG